jgi:hypothetical protein
MLKMIIQCSRMTKRITPEGSLEHSSYSPVQNRYKELKKVEPG